MRRRIGATAATTIALALVITPVVPAFAQFGGGYATCSSTWSYTWANSTASITHMHQADLLKRQVDRPAGVSTFKGHYRYNGATWMELDTSGNYSGAVFGCSA